MIDDKLREAFLNFLYSAEPELPADERYFHDDIPQMTDSKRQRELGRVRERLIHDQRPGGWLLERYERLKEAVDHAH